MPMPSRFESLAALAASLAVGFALGWFWRGDPPSPQPVPARAASRAAVAGAPSADALPLPSAEAARAFEAVRAEQTTDYQRRLRLAQVVAGLDRAGVVAALEREHAHIPGSGPERILPTEALLARFAELDPPGAVLWLAQTYQGNDLESEWLSVTLDTWLARDATAALAWGRSLPAGPLRESVNSELLDQMVALDPAGTARRIAALTDREAPSISSLFTRLAEKDLASACAQAAQLPPDRMKRATEGIVEAWARHQPTDAYAWIAQIAPGALRDAATSQLYETWGDKDPAAAAAWLTAHGGPDVGKYASELAGTWAKHDVTAARAWSDHLPPQARQEAVAQVISVWSETDPRGATEYAMTLPPKQRGSEVSTTLSQWAKQDLTAAAAWLGKQGPGSVRNNALSAVCGVWADQDPRACMDWLAQQPDDAAAKRQRGQTLSTWAESSSEEVWQWSQTLPDAKRRAEAEAAALTALAGSDPAQAGARLAQLPADDQGDAASEVASKWTATDPAAASRWAGGLPKGDARTSAVSAVASAWAGYDAKGAAAWLNGLPPGDTRDAGVMAMIDTGPEDVEPMSLVRLAQSMQDTNLRNNALNNVALNWLNQDRPKARAWIEQCQDFSPAQRSSLLSESGDDDDQEPRERTVVTP